MYEKENVGIKRNHESIGRTVNQAEFRGYVIAKLEETNSQHSRLREDLNDLKLLMDQIHRESIGVHSSHDGRLKDLELWKANLKGYGTGVASLSGIVAAVVVYLITNYVF